jgi:phospholipid/cholesterol/gamma-HCH transport system permease protein
MTRIYKSIISFTQFTIEFFFAFLKFNKKNRISFRVLIRQILFTGYEALPLISFLAISIGGLIIIEGNSILTGFGQSNFLYTVLVSLVTRELSCLLTAFILVARSATAISTELGNMVVNQEIEALISFGISPIDYLVVPRIYGVLVSMMVLVVYFNLAAFLGGWLVAALFTPINLFSFINSLFTELTINDILSSLIKSITFGLTIALISCYHGLRVSFAITEVPQRTIKTVVSSLTGIIVLDIFITLIFYF